jgi:tRNA-modifying protein YgfZ
MSRFETLVVDQTHAGQIRVTGEDRIRFLQGMCTANVEALAPGAWTWATALNAKGRVMSVFEIVMREEELLLLCDLPWIATATTELLQRYAVMDDVVFEPVSLPLHRIWETPASVWDAPPIFAPPPSTAASAEAIEIRRIEAGLPRFGIDINADNFPFETPYGRFIDYTKGCYIGQEPVFRVHSKGQAAKALRGLRFERDAAASAGAFVSHPNRADAGVVTSATLSPVLGHIALAYMHRTVWEPGGKVTVRDVPATVVELPFG